MSIDRERMKQRGDGEGAGGGNYLREVIILNVSIRAGGNHSREAIN